MAFEKKIFGETAKGDTAYLYTVTNKNGMKAVYTDFGAILVSLYVADRDGNMDDVILGFDNPKDYYLNNPNHGATIGRFANRIGGAKYTLNGVTYELDKNDGNNNLHSGFDGYHNRMWDVVTNDADNSITFSLFSKDMDQGFPGNFNVSVKYTLTDDNELVIEYNGKSDKDTLVNMTNHSYFNLLGEGKGTILDHKVWIDSDEFTYADEESIPNGEIRKVAGTPMDFNEAKTIGRDIEMDYDMLKFGTGYDHNWILKTNRGQINLVAKLMEDTTGRIMEVYTDLPGMQMYTGNFLKGDMAGKSGVKYAQRMGVCFETQYYPNAINVPSFPQPVLKAGDTYHTITSYKFLTDK